MKNYLRLSTGVLILGLAVSSVFITYPTFAKSDNENSNSGHGHREKQHGRERATERHAQKAETSNTDGHVAAENSAPHSNPSAERCAAQKPQVTTVLAKTVEQGEAQIAVIDKIATRVQTFYEEKRYDVEHYDTLVADVNRKHDAAFSALTELRGSKDAFNCETSPDQGLSTFRTIHQRKNAALKEYKDSVKRLIIAIKSAQSKESD